MQLRLARSTDAQGIRDLYHGAFPNSEAEPVSQLALDLLNEAESSASQVWVATDNERLIGHVAFSPIHSEDTEAFLGYILAPLAVSSRRQKQGVGTRLVQHGLHQITALKASVVLVYGDPQYYGRFGFSTETAQAFIPPYPLQYPHGWLGLVLNSIEQSAPSIKIRCTEPLRDPSLW